MLCAVFCADCCGVLIVPFVVAVLDRVKAFLPQLQAANTELEHGLSSGQQDLKAVQVDAVDEEPDGPYIQMVCVCSILSCCSVILSFSGSLVSACVPLRLCLSFCLSVTFIQSF